MMFHLGLVANIVYFLSGFGVVSFTFSAPSNRRDSFAISSPSAYRHISERWSLSIGEDSNTFSNEERNKTKDATFASALCIVPPDDAWDTVQRARHMARDGSYHFWPPALRLFHPFVPTPQLSDVALKIAKFIEEYEIEPFEIVLSEWSVIPIVEEIELQVEVFEQQLPSQEEDIVEEERESDVDILIAKEEQVGKNRREKRRLVIMEQGGADIDEKSNDEGNNGNKSDENVSPREKLKKQWETYEEFNGPCLICLEPDTKSKERLEILREALRVELFQDYDAFSPGSSVSNANRLPQFMADTTFRAVLPIGRFKTVTSAIQMAKRLKGLWDPLSFTVANFQLISRNDLTEKILDDSKSDGEFADNPEYMLKKTKEQSDEERFLSTDGQYGCDASVAFLGEELPMDEDSNREAVELLMKDGTPGGMERLLGLEGDSGIETKLEEEKNTDSDIETWLDEDEDDFDEGMVVVIGRTHLFTGEKRVYQGMPASSALDGTDRMLGDLTGASARRRPTKNREARVWVPGEFGRRDSDYTK